MIIQCAWCKKHLGEKAPLSDQSVTHSICESCMKKATKKNPGQEWEQSVRGKVCTRVVGGVLYQVVQKEARSWRLLESTPISGGILSVGTFPSKEEALARAALSASDYVLRRNPSRKNPAKWEPPKPLTLIATSKSTRDQFLLAGDGNVYARTLSGWVNHGTLEEFTTHALRHWKPLKWEDGTNPGEAWHAEKEREAERSERAVKKPSLKDFYHGKAIAHFESGLKARALKSESRNFVRRNPLAVFSLGNPPDRINTKIAGVVYNRCLEVRAEKTGTFSRGLWKHPFSKRSQVQILALDNGDLLLHSVVGIRLWKKA